MTNRLFSFGCSHTFGDSLFDEFPRAKKGIHIASNYAWPNILAQKLNRRCINLSRKGASNKEICYHILNTNFFTEDFVFILWTYSDRTCVFQNDFTIKQLSINQNSHSVDALNKENKIYYTHFNTDYDSIINDYCYFNLANLYLQTLNLELVVNLLITNDQVNNNFVPLFWNKVKFLDIYFDNFRSIYPKASDGGHLGEEGHIVYANKIFDKLFIKKG